MPFSGEVGCQPREEVNIWEPFLKNLGGRWKLLVAEIQLSNALGEENGLGF